MIGNMLRPSKTKKTAEERRADIAAHKARLQDAAQKLADIVMEHLDSLPEEERVAALKRFDATTDQIRRQRRKVVRYRSGKAPRWVDQPFSRRKKPRSDPRQNGSRK